MSSGLRIIVLGILGRDPVAGVAWQALHYVEGFRRLGHDVVYLEDTGDWAPDADDGCRPTLEYISRLMAWCGMADRWAYRAAALGGRLFGLSEPELARALREADALVNVTASTRLREEHLRVPVRIYLETDPGLPQIAIAKGNDSVRAFLAAHTHHFSFGLNLHAPDCEVPRTPFAFETTRQPVVLDWWTPAAGSGERGAPFTTVATWRESAKDVRFRGETYTWSKHAPFLRFLELPRHTPEPLELALACEDREAVARLRRHGWRVVDALPLSRDIEPYRDYLRASRGELTVAKDQYTRLRTGWFSDRSACYLAAGRPVITQETGFHRHLPTGKGLFGFETRDEAVAALETVAGDYAAQRRAAREIAAEHFAAEKVLAELLEDAGL